MKIYLFIILMNVYCLTIGQLSISNLTIYPDPPTTDTINRHNDDFTVRVRTLNGQWENLYEYKTYVNSGSSRLDWSASSFVTFSHQGTVEMEITSNWAPINSVLIRPQSKGIPYTLTGNTIRFQIADPQQLSVEINGNRYRNLHIFANPNYGRIQRPTKIFSNSVINTLPNDTYEAEDGEVIYFEPGAIVKGQIVIKDKTNVKIMGYGIIDLQHLDKNYSGGDNIPPEYKYIQGVTIRNSSNVSIDGIIINDPQQMSLNIVESNMIDINNVKLFSRVIWGDGIAIKGSDNININKSFLRTADDAISIFSTRVGWAGNPNPQLRNVYDIKVENVILYADQSHPIEIGFHGPRNSTVGEGNWMGRFRFNNIDILEHDEPLVDYQGVISINCADGNTCTDFIFKNIFIEDFTQGRLFTIKVEPAGYGAAITDGYRVRNIVFNNLTYNGSGEGASIIKGINCEKFVDGVHFQDFKVNNNYVLKLSDYNFDTNSSAYNITFQEANNFSTILPSGFYKIRNKQSLHYLTATPLESDSNGGAYYVATSTNQNGDNQIWEVINLGGHYRIKSVSNENYLHNSDDFYINDCNSRYILTYPVGELTTQEWKIVPKPGGGYTINNAYTRGYLEPSTQQININTKYVINNEKNGLNIQLWEFEPIEIFGFDHTEKLAQKATVQLSPVPFSHHLTIKNSKNIKEWYLSDIYSTLVKSGKNHNSQNKIEVDVKELRSGVYYFNAILKNGKLFQKTLFKK